jgi:YVTN family beta-propeller protein
MGCYTSCQLGVPLALEKGATVNYLLLGFSFFTCLLLASGVADDPRPENLLLVANQMEHSVLLVDPMSKQVLATMGVDINGHEVAVSPDGRFGYVPIYGNTWVGKPGSNGSTIHVVDLRRARTLAVIDLGKEVRPHSAHFGPDGLLYVSAELANAIYIVDTNTRSVVGEIPTGATHTHMFVISPDGRRIYTANNEAGSVSVLDLRARTLIATIPISKKVQRISISPDGKSVFTQDQETPRIAVIDTATNAVVRSISFPRIVFSSAITKDGRWLLANSESGKLFVVDLASGAVTKTFDTPDVPVLPTPGEFALAPDGMHAYVSCPQGGTIEILNLKDWKLEEPIRLTKGVDGMAWVPSAAN